MKLKPEEEQLIRLKLCNIFDTIFIESMSFSYSKTFEDAIQFKKKMIEELIDLFKECK